MTQLPLEESIRSRKAYLRSVILKERKSLEPSEVARLSAAICQTFLDTDEYRNSSTILLYKAYNNEVDTDMIFERAILDKKRVFYPLVKTTGEEPDMFFYGINDLSRLKVGYKGIMEPDPLTAGGTLAETADICVTPGAVFDGKCHRIGYGRAFYDRFIRLNEPRSVIGLAYDLQIADEFETEEMDRPVDMVITESRIYRR